MAGLTAMIGTVSKVSGTGFQVHEQPGTWLNISHYAKSKPSLPTAGQRVALGLDGRGFVQTLAVQDGATKPEASAPTSSPPDVILSTRLACLQSAATFPATRPDAKSPDVLRVAEAFEQGTLR